MSKPLHPTFDGESGARQARLRARPRHATYVWGAAKEFKCEGSNSSPSREYPTLKSEPLTKAAANAFEICRIASTYLRSEGFGVTRSSRMCWPW